MAGKKLRVLTFLAAAALAQAGEWPESDTGGGAAGPGGTLPAGTVTGQLLTWDDVAAEWAVAADTLVSGSLTLAGDVLVSGADIDIGTTTTTATIDALRTSSASGSVGMHLRSAMGLGLGTQTAFRLEATGADYTSDTLFEVIDTGTTAMRVTGGGDTTIAGVLQINGTSGLTWAVSSLGLSSDSAAIGIGGGDFGLVRNSLSYDGDAALDGDLFTLEWDNFDSYDTAGDEDSVTAEVLGVVTKGTTGDPAYGWTGLVVENTADDTLRAYYDGGYRTINGPLTYPLTAQYDATSTALADVTGWSAPLAAGRWYRIAIYMQLTPDVAGGSTWDFDGGTATMTTVMMETTELENATGVTTLNPTRVTAIATDFTSTIGPTSTYAVTTGLVLVNAGGTFEPRYAQEVDTGTSSVLVGSFMMIQDVTP